MTARLAGEAAPRTPLQDLLAVSDYVQLGEPPTSRDPLSWPGYADQLTALRHRTGLAQAVTAGHAVIDGEQCVLLSFQFAFMGGSMGEAEGDLIVRAVEAARLASRPLVSVARSGGARMQEGTAALLQMSRIAQALVTLARSGVPHIGVIDDPTTGGIWAALVAAADVLIGRAGAQVGFAGSRVRSSHGGPEGASTVEGKHAAGFVDVVTDGADLTGVVGGYLRLLSPATRGAAEPPPLPVLAADQGVDELTGWDSVRAARSDQRRTADDYLAAYFDEVLPVWGDRTGGVDPRIACGFGRTHGRTVAFVSQRGQQVGAAGFRTATRLLGLANRLSIPVVTFIDTSGAENGPDAEREGVGTAIAVLLQEVAASSVPVLSVVVGQGVSGGAVALINPDNVWMAPDSYLAVIAPEYAAAILKRGSADVPELADRLALSPAQLRGLGLVTGILAAPQTSR